ncbi:hypothetical protein ACQ4PT_021785 [Festuca glaucescens]
MSSTSGTASAPSQGLAAAFSALCQALLDSPDAGLQLNAVTALLNLSILDANKKRIMHADGPWRAKDNAAAVLNRGGAARGELGDGEDVEEGASSSVSTTGCTARESRQSTARESRQRTALEPRRTATAATRLSTSSFSASTRARRRASSSGYTRARTAASGRGVALLHCVVGLHEGAHVGVGSALVAGRRAPRGRARRRRRGWAAPTGAGRAGGRSSERAGGRRRPRSRRASCCSSAAPPPRAVRLPRRAGHGGGRSFRSRGALQRSVRLRSELLRSSEHCRCCSSGPDDVAALPALLIHKQIQLPSPPSSSRLALPRPAVLFPSGDTRRGAAAKQGDPVHPGSSSYSSPPLNLRISLLLTPNPPKPRLQIHPRSAPSLGQIKQSDIILFFLGAQMDWQGQKSAEMLMQVLLVASAVAAFLTGYTMADFQLMLLVYAGGVVLTALVTVPNWPFFNRHPLKWLDTVEADRHPRPQISSTTASTGGKKKTGKNK